jgi:hypothetical protein
MPNFPSTPTVAKNRFEDHFNLPRIPLKKYLPFEEARLLYPRVNLMNRLLTSKRIHGYILNDGDVLIHPKGIIEAMNVYYRYTIRKGMEAH